MNNLRISAFMCPIKLMKCVPQHARSISTAASLHLAANLRQRSSNLLKKSAAVLDASRQNSGGVICTNNSGMTINRLAKAQNLLFTNSPTNNSNRMLSKVQNGRNSFITGNRRHFCNQSEMAGATSFHVQDYEDFKERVLNSDKPIVVDFFADWCGPCKLLGPRLESMIDSKGGEVMLAKVNVDDNTELAMEYGVRSVPTVIGFKDGQAVSQFVGLTEDAEIKSFLNNLTNS